MRLSPDSEAVWWRERRRTEVEPLAGLQLQGTSEDRVY